jgi:hypothetical protein
MTANSVPTTQQPYYTCDSKFGRIIKFWSSRSSRQTNETAPSKTTISSISLERACERSHRATALHGSKGDWGVGDCIYKTEKLTQLASPEKTVSEVRHRQPLVEQDILNVLRALLYFLLHYDGMKTT